jgi:hypothetical protein
MRIEVASFWRRSAVVASLGLLAGCPGQLDDKASFLAYAESHAGASGSSMNEAGANDGTAGTAPAGACGDVTTRIFVPTCGGTGCHSAKAPQQGLDLESAGVAARVVGISGKMCPVILADPANPAGSLMYQKLAVKPPCGAQMPLARPALSAADSACVLAWIAAQAP